MVVKFYVRAEIELLALTVWSPVRPFYAVVRIGEYMQ
jgi:hypothetical protein